MPPGDGRHLRPRPWHPVSIGVLLTSFASDRTPATQRRTEQALLDGAALGEAHLHASSLRGEVVGLGAFHAGSRERRTGAGVLAWRRRTGGRAVAGGDGFVVLTLALPHRSALVAERAAGAPSRAGDEPVRARAARLAARRSASSRSIPASTRSPSRVAGSPT